MKRPLPFLQYAHKTSGREKRVIRCLAKVKQTSTGVIHGSALVYDTCFQGLDGQVMILDSLFQHLHKHRVTGPASTDK